MEFTEDQRLETLMGCHERAIRFFGGVTETCLYDNMKTVVAGTDDQGEVVWNERFARFASHHGFLLRRCRPYRARTKGKVENGVGYVRKNFWPRVQTFTDLHDLNEQALYWLNHVANARVHGTMQERPIDRLVKERLKSISEPFECVEFHTRKVSADTLVSFEGNRYSVPIRRKNSVGKPVPQPSPRLMSNPIPEVVVRPLAVYEQFLNEEAMRS